jgi:hypothetical protein
VKSKSNALKECVTVKLEQDLALKDRSDGEEQVGRRSVGMKYMW